jgi:orotate phosphoribosyltransferase
MDESQVRELLLHSGALLQGHFVYTSGKHGDQYINKDALYMYPERVAMVCRSLALPFVKGQMMPDVVVAPAIGAIVLGQGVTSYLYGYSGGHVRSVYAEKAEGGDFVIKRGYEEFIPGKNVLVVEDLFTTGGSAKKVVDAVRALDGKVMAVVGLANRGGVKAEDVGNPPIFQSLLNITMAAHDPVDCPMCRMRMPVNPKVGHGAKFLAAKQK